MGCGRPKRHLDHCMTRPPQPFVVFRHHVLRQQGLAQPCLVPLPETSVGLCACMAARNLLCKVNKMSALISFPSVSSDGSLCHLWLGMLCGMLPTPDPILKNEPGFLPIAALKQSDFNVLFIAKDRISFIFCFVFTAR